MKFFAFGLGFVALGSLFSPAASVPYIKARQATGASISQVETTSFTLEFDPTNSWTGKLSSPGVKTHFTLPTGYTGVNSLQSSFVLYTDATLATSFATVAATSSPASSAQSGTETVATSDIVNAVLTIPAESRTLASGIFTQLVQATGAVPVATAGSIDAVASNADGTTSTFAGVPFTQTLTLQGLQGLAGSPLIVTAFDITGGSSAGLTVSLTATLNNPSNIALKHNSDVTFNLLSGTEVIGTVTIPNFQLAIGANTLTATGLYSPQTPSALAAGLKLISAYVNGNNSDVSIAGTTSSTPLEPLKDALATVKVNSVLPGLGTKLIAASRIYSNSSSLITKTVQAGFNAVNPTSASLTITKIVSTIYRNSSVLGTLNATVNIVIPAKSTVRSPWIPASIIVNTANIAALAAAQAGTLYTRIVATDLQINIGGYVTDLTYSQDNIFTPFDGTYPN
ncbi:hypothetical protein M427DRAFT_66163 [Gonapodya prolifera JEL478]|uniref:Uncharacterized protein n=1 Tax=Gonapodya prolifera (strain JEL478) TaxID=1344416 RepID=A0A139AVF8_GONPJ|nr:hypothetical protein M427DRAFT_66163 [Gonapodya prolifera JEL478]|eukprot:KXS20721.1 hypothetical protein M427DRAFT_66163 [Gonapodya prolifera JEL478]